MLSKTTTSWYKDGAEIMESEYLSEQSVIIQKADWVNRIYAGEVSLDEAPAEWRDEIEHRVAERLAQAEDAPETTHEERIAVLEATTDDMILLMADLIGGV